MKEIFTQNEIKNEIKNKKDLNLFELMFMAITSVSIGVILWSWTFITSLITPFLEIIGLNYIFLGLWMIPAILPPLVIRKPLVAIASSLIAAFIEGLLSKWGVMALAWGLVQGIFAEFIFFIFKYQKWNKKTIFIATLSASFAGYGVDFFLKKFWLINSHILIIQIISITLSAFIFCAIPTIWLSRRLVKAGLLNSFLIVNHKNEWLN